MRRVAVAVVLVLLLAASTGASAASEGVELELGSRVGYVAVDAVRSTPGGPDAEVDLFTTMVRDGAALLPQRVTDTRGADAVPFQWSPGGTRLLVQTRNRFDTAVGYTVRTVFGTRVADVADAADDADWSPQGGRIVLGHVDRVWTVRDDGTGSRETFQVPGVGPFDAQSTRVDVDWAPAGDVIKVVATASQTEPPARSTWFVDVDDGTATRLDAARDAKWAPDGSAFAYADGDAIVIAPASRPTEELARIEGAAGGDADAMSEVSWEPAGDRIAYARSSGQDAQDELWTARRDGTEAGKIADLPGQASLVGPWSSDGGVIAVAGRFPDATNDEAGYVALVDVAIGAVDVRLRAERATLSGWLPDGRAVVADVVGFDGRPGRDVVMIPASDAPPRRLPNPSDEARPESPYAINSQVAPQRLGPTARIMGPDRVATAIELSRAAFDRADHVVLARSDAYPDALAGVPLAHQLGGPLLLSYGERLDPRVAEELERLGVEQASVLGSADVMSQALIDDLDAAGVTTERIGGADRFETAAMIADRLDTSTAYVVEGAHADPDRGWPDAVAVSALAATSGHPVLLTVQDRLPEATAGWLESHNPETATVIGREAAVSRNVAQAIDSRAGTVTRIGGVDRYDTSRQIAETATAAGLDPSTTLLVRGDDWPDALTAGVTATRAQASLVLMPPQGASGSATQRWLTDQPDRIDTAILVGSTSAITAKGQRDVIQILD